ARCSAGKLSWTLRLLARDATWFAPNDPLVGDNERMSRRLDEHQPGLNSSSSGSVFPGRNHSSGPGGFHRPGGGAFGASSASGGASGGAAGGPRPSPKPPSQRQPLALLQDSIHVGGASVDVRDSMQGAGVQFSVQSGFQPRIPSGGLSQLGHNHNPSPVHHSMSGQSHGAQAHAAQMHGQQQFQRLKVEDALSYLDQVKFRFGNQPQVYNDFLDIMKEFKSQSIDTPGVIQRVSNLFKGHPELIVGFNTFLPPGYRIEVQANEQVNVSMPGSMSTTITAGGIISTGPTGAAGPSAPGAAPPVGPNAAAPPAPPTSSPPSNAKPGHLGLGGGLPGTVPTGQGAPGSQAGQAPHGSPGSQGSFPPSQGTNQALHGGASPLNPAASQASQPVEFNHAINYVNKIKNRFQGQPDIYKQFLEILHTYQKEQRNLKEGIQTGGKPLTESEVYAQVAKLFQNQEDLLQEFGQFLPDANGASTHSLVTHGLDFSFQPVKAVNNDHTAAAKKPSSGLSKPSLVSGLGSSLKQGSTPLKRPLSHLSGSVTKKQKMTSLKDVTLAEAGKHGTLNEFAFFDKVRRALRGQEVYENFLRCLILYNQEIVSRSELVHLVTPFLGKFPELFKWFKDFIGYKDLGGQIEPIPNKVVQQERISGDPSMEIDYSSCKRYGASYRALPKNIVQPKCSGRTPLCKEVLNDTWVSFPSWSEDSTFVSSRKTQYEEYIYRCEDERFELDVVVETNLSTIRVLEAVQKKMQRLGAEERQRFQLGDNLGGSSAVLQQQAIRRIYGDKAADIVEGLKRNPVVAVPLVLRRKREEKAEPRRCALCELRKVRMTPPAQWRWKLRGHLGFGANYKTTKASLMKFAPALYFGKKLHCAKFEASTTQCGPHPLLHVVDAVLLSEWNEAIGCILAEGQECAAVSVADNVRLNVFLRCPWKVFWCSPRCETFMTDQNTFGTVSRSAGRSVPRFGPPKIPRMAPHQRVFRLRQSAASSAQLPTRSSTTRGQPRRARGTPPDDSYALFFVNDHWYLFFRLHHLLCERLTKIYRQSTNLAADEAKDRKDRKESTAVALRLKPKSEIEVEDYYLVFLDMVKSLLDGNMDSTQYEDTLREMFGIHAYTVFTLDKVVQNAVRQLQHIMCDEVCLRCTELFLEEHKVGAAGGPCSSASHRAHLEGSYQKKAEQALVNDTCFKLVLYQREAKLTIELIDTESDVSEDPVEIEKWSEYVEKYAVGDDSISDELREQLAKKPVFLPRNVRARRQQARKQEREAQMPSASAVAESHHSNNSTNNKSPCTNDESTNDEAPFATAAASASLLGAGAAAPAVPGKADVADDTQCRFNLSSYKMVFVVNSSSYIYNHRALRRARQSHRKVSERMHRNFGAWHQGWLEKNVSEEQDSQCEDWLQGLDYECITHCIKVQDCTRPPYCHFRRFRTAPAPPSPANDEQS
ncbi:unnamed protein product, partial [Ixodes hexagonus]